MNTPSMTPEHPAILVVPRIRVQNANAISSPLTWGFPAITAFTGLMTALERALGPDSGIEFYRVGVICHAFEPQITTGGYTRAFHLTRNPLQKDGSSSSIVEEGRAHLDISLVFDTTIAAPFLDESRRTELATRIATTLGGMRIAGGSVLPPASGPGRRWSPSELQLRPDTDEEQQRQFRRLLYRLLPGFALVEREDLLAARLNQLRERNPQASVLDAWLDLSRLNSSAVIPEDDGEESPATVEWVTERKPGWLVPIPVGFAALTDLLPAGSVEGARDSRVPFRFVETLWSIGQWISPHRLTRFEDLFWEAQAPTEEGLYRCINSFGSTQLTC